MKKISWDETMEYLEILSQISLTEEEKQETAGELKKILAYMEKLEELEERYSQAGDEAPAPFVVSNVVNAKSFDIKTPDVSVKVAPDKTYLVETRMVDGRPCIVIAVDDHVTVNGIEARTVKR